MTDRLPQVMVAVPACNEEERLPACLASLLLAIDVARREGRISRAAIAVGAHRCLDRTSQIAHDMMSSQSSVDMVVWDCDEAMSVGRLRTQLIRRATRLLGWDPASSWLFSTDADTHVPSTWIRDGLSLVAAARADLLVGLVDLNPERLDPTTLARHEQIVKDGILPDGSHLHAYAANLLIHQEVFDAVGGFPDVGNGEEHALIRAVAASGFNVGSTCSLRVTTSGRTLGRADLGLASLLHSLQHPVPLAVPVAGRGHQLQTPTPGESPSMGRRLTARNDHHL